MAVKKLEHVGVMVSDLEVSIGFYQDVLGLDLLDRFDANESTGLAFLGDRASGQVIVELICGKNNTFPDEGKVHHIAFTVDDIEGEIERLRSSKVHFTSDEISTLTNGSKYIFFKGPDGETLELFQPKS
ncbi:lactoylglutathione lyase [Neobacillus niacini]|jgi:lactoylglutathione lyase|uniref:VOC family protein n=1 Tax=Neobacillus driksii TaxID=3035913 RepID=UPI002789FEE6|nr:VOC family protein [Neobacillus niacini]MDQ0975060.1 lactoylglutathione lyase [Neobacillus niacini]